MLADKMLVLLVALLTEAYAQNDCKFSAYVSPKGGTVLIRSPRHPDKYPPSSTCYWYYYTDSDRRLSLDCYSVQMGSDAPWECSDKLTVVGSTDDSQNVNCSPFNVESTSNKIMLILNSMRDSKGGRFSCAIRSIKEENCDCGWSPKTRIVGGIEAGINEFPLMVSVYDVKRGMHACGGSIISKNFVLTAAHCLDVLDVRLTGLLIGEHDMSTGAETSYTRLHRAAEFIIHPDYNRKLSWNDIGLIRTAKPMLFNSRVGPVCLPFNRPFIASVGDFVTAIGWGTTSFAGPTSDVLMKTSLKVVPDKNCKDVFNQSASSGKQVCTYSSGKDTCQMDSGGPLITHDVRTSRYFLAALVSFGPNSCGGSDPSVNTRITPYLDWIQSRTGEMYCVK